MGGENVNVSKKVGVFSHFVSISGNIPVAWSDLYKCHLSKQFASILYSAVHDCPTFVNYVEYTFLK